MPMLWSPFYEEGADYVLIRPYLTRFAYGWWQHSVAQVGGSFVFTEVPFGGYNQHIEFEPWFWLWSGKTIRVKDVFANVWEEPPDHSSQISCGSVKVKSFFDPINNMFTVAFENIPNDGHYTYFKTPPAPPSYWAAPLPDNPPP